MVPADAGPFCMIDWHNYCKNWQTPFILLYYRHWWNRCMV